ncbi:hypothetical protein DFH09DRAFT_1333455 [Mycena vulgaris]|nr:hypothetical protein DFH09DRAFT_1333455 [Mycena vulgaris]
MSSTASSSALAVKSTVRGSITMIPTSPPATRVNLPDERLSHREIEYWAAGIPPGAPSAPSAVAPRIFERAPSLPSLHDNRLTARAHRRISGTTATEESSTTGHRTRGISAYLSSPLLSSGYRSIHRASIIPPLKPSARSHSCLAASRSSVSTDLSLPLSHRTTHSGAISSSSVSGARDPRTQVTEEWYGALPVHALVRVLVLSPTESTVMQYTVRGIAALVSFGPDGKINPAQDEVSLIESLAVRTPTPRKRGPSRSLSPVRQSHSVLRNTSAVASIISTVRHRPAYVPRCYSPTPAASADSFCHCRRSGSTPRMTSHTTLHTGTSPLSLLSSPFPDHKPRSRNLSESSTQTSYGTPLSRGMFLLPRTRTPRSPLQSKSTRSQRSHWLYSSTTASSSPPSSNLYLSTQPPADDPTLSLTGSSLELSQS